MTTEFSGSVEDGCIFVAHIARCGSPHVSKLESSRDDEIEMNMAHTHTNLIYHVVFSTQGLLPLIKTECKQELFAYMGALIKEMRGKPILINGMTDHVHILILLPPNVSLSNVIKFIKANSSRWMKQRFGRPFAWQKGFGAFSVSRSGVSAVSRYIREQEAHHSKMDLRTEYVALLEKNEVEFDERYLWK